MRRPMEIIVWKLRLLLLLLMVVGLWCAGG